MQRLYKDDVIVVFNLFVYIQLLNFIKSPKHFPAMFINNSVDFLSVCDMFETFGDISFVIAVRDLFIQPMV